MRTLYLALLSATLLALGCRTNPNQTLLERDLRLQEDKIFELESLLDDCHAAREATIRENEALKKELTGGDRGAGSDYSRPAVERSVPRNDSAPRSRVPKSGAPALEAPTIELPEATDAPRMESGPVDDSAAIEGKPTRLVINRRLTGGLDRDGQGGDEGIFVVFEPRDAEGHLIKSPGSVSVVVMDPAQQGDAARVARWDFDASEVPGHFQNTALARGLQFELAWPNEPPKSRDLVLFVRFTTLDGKKLNADTKIEVRTPQDRQTRAWSATQSASRLHNRTPSSRLKTPAPRSRTSRDDDAATGQRASDSRTSGDDVREASRSGRPEWKPYR